MRRLVWVDQNTGEARGAAAACKEDDASSVGLCKKWHAEERHRQTRAQSAQVLRRRDVGRPGRRRVGRLDDTAGHGLRGLRAVALRGAARAARPGQAAAAEERPAGGRRPAVADATATKAARAEPTKARGESRTKARSREPDEGAGETRTVLGVTPRRQRLLEDAAASGRLSPSRWCAKFVDFILPPSSRRRLRPSP